MVAQTKRSHGWAGLVVVLGWCVNSGQAETVYDNVGTTNSQPTYFPSTIEYGDEIRLGGIGREVRQFRTEYFGDLPATNAATARIRFYANDGPGRYPSPATLLFESDAFPVLAGYNSIALDDLEVAVPDIFTFTVEFSGLTGAVGQQAGLLLYDPPSAGFSYDDFWMRTGTNWTLFRLNIGVKANFAARFSATDILTVHLDGPQVLPDGGVKLQLTGLVGRTCVVQTSTNLTSWNALTLFDFTRNQEEFVDPNRSAFDRRFYRAVTTVGGPMKFASPTRTTNGLTELRVAGPERLSFLIEGSADLVNWSSLSTNTFASRPVVFADPESGSAARRFFRTRLLP